MIDDYSNLKSEFQKININDLNALKKWFNKHSYLNIQDLSMIIGKCSRDVRALKRQCGIKGRAPKVKRRATTKTTDLAELPSNWRTKEWLSENLALYGSNAVIRATGLTPKRFYEILRKLEVKLPGRINKNPCCSKTWCYRHYTELGYSAKKCARLAGVTHPTFIDWLIKFKIQIRVSKELYQIPIELKHLVVKLKAQPLVKQVKIRPSYLYVKYGSGIARRYIYKLIDSNQWVLNTVPKIMNEYETDLNSNIEYSGHIIIQNIDKYTIFERDIAVHTFIKKLSTRGWLPLNVPDHILLKELNMLKNINPNNYIKDGAFTSIYSKNMTRYIMLHFFDHGYIWYYFSRPKIMWKMSKELLSTKYKFNVYNLIKRITKKKCNFRFPNPALYSMIFKRLGVKGTILDLKIGTGARAVAAGLINCEYLVYGDDDILRLNRAIENGFADFMNVKCGHYNGVDKVDLVICDNDLSHSDIKYALSFADRANCIMVYVPREKKTLYQEMYKPKSMIKVITHPVNRDPNYYFIW